MTYHTIHQKRLAGTYGEVASGICVIVRVSCSASLQVSEAVLREAAPLYGRITPTLLAYHNGREEGDAVYGGFDASIVVKIEVRQGDEDSTSATERYLDLLDRLLDALPKDYTRITELLEEVGQWSNELYPNRRAPIIGSRSGTYS